MNSDLLSTALAAIRAGVSIIPIDHRNKRPAAHLLPRNNEGKATWKPYQERIASEDEVRGWFKAGIQSFAVVCGKVSGGLLVLDFDAPGFIDRWAEAAGKWANGLPVQQTGGGGYQVLMRCPDTGGNDKLAWVVDDAEATGRTIAIETRGEGGYAVVAPSMHPSGNRYQWLGDRTVTDVPTVTQAHADQLLAAARALDEAPMTRQEKGRIESQAIQAYQKRLASRNGHASVIEAFNAAHSSEGLLERHGYRPGPRGRYIRPGGTSESVSVKDGRSCHWSSNDPLNDGRDKAGCGCHDAFDVYAIYEHGGDVGRAVKAAAALLGIKPGDHPRARSGTHGAALAAIELYRSFPVATLPTLIARFVDEGAKALGCDPAYIALPLLAGLGSAIGNSRRIRMKASWTEPPVLWTVVLGDSGTLKSPAFDLALQPIRLRQTWAMKEYKKAQAEYRDAKEQHDEAVTAWRKAKPADRGDKPEEPEAPVCERLWCSDTTVEALADRLSNAPRGLLVARDELAGWLASFNQYKAGQGGDVAHWLEMHRAGPLLVDRKSGDKTTIHVPRASICIAGGIQPETLRRCLTAEFFDNGLAARLLLAMPPMRVKRWTEADIDDGTQAAVSRLFADLLSLKPSIDGNGEPEPADVTLTDGAKALWVAFYNTHAQEQAELGGELSAAWSKLEGYAARLSLVVHCVRQVSGEAVDPYRCDEVSMASGIALAEWFGHEAKRVYGVLREGQEDRDRRRLVELLQAKGGRATVRELLRSSRQFPNAAEWERALNELVEAGMGRWQNPKPGATGGHPARVFHLNNEPGAVAGADAPTVDTTSDGDSANGGSVNWQHVNGHAQRGPC